MALRRLTTAARGPAAACALRRHPATGVPPPPPALPRFLGTTRTLQNDIAIQRTSYDVEYIRDAVKRAKSEDEFMRRIIRWTSRAYKTLEWVCYVSVVTVSFTGINLIIDNYKAENKGHPQPTARG